MSNVALILAGLILASTPWIIRSPFVGLIVVIVVNPFEALFPLPVGLTLGRMAGIITVASWMRFVISNQEAKSRWSKSKIKRVVWTFPAVCLCGSIIGLMTFGEASSVLKTSSVILLAFMALMVESQVTSPSRLQKLMMAIVVSSLAIVIFPLADYFGYDLYSVVGYEQPKELAAERAVGLKGNANSLGISCALGIFGVVTAMSGQPNPFRSIVYAICGLAMLAGLVLSGSRTFMIAGLGCIGFFCVFRIFGPAKGRANAVIGSLLIAFSLPWVWVMAPESVQKRMVVIGGSVENRTIDRFDFANYQRNRALDVLAGDPIFGVGLSNFKNATREKYGAHDTFTAIVGETGVLGIASFVFITLTCINYLLSLIIATPRNGDLTTYGYSVGLLSAFIAVLIAGLGGNILFFGRWYWITIGLSAALKLNVENRIVSVLGNRQKSTEI